MKALRWLVLLLALAAGVFFALRLGSVLKKPVLTLDRTQVVLEKVRRIQKVNLASVFASKITPDERSNLVAGGSRFYFKYVAMVCIDAYVDYSQARYEAARRRLALPGLEFSASIMPGASFLWRAEGGLSGQPELERRFTQREEEIMRAEVLETVQAPGSALRLRAYESCRQFFARLDPELAVEFADEK